ncbi:MAG: C40 family peptidase [Alphaproteobacteria bacterium]
MTTPQLDPRRNAFREDLADISLKEKVKAQRYAQGELRQVVAATAPLRVMPRFDAPTRLAVVGKEGRFLELSRGGFVFNGHVQPIEEKGKDFVRHAERLIGTPYLWGGRSSTGIDCSGLVQIALEGMGSKCPRDTDMQEAELGTAVSNPDLNKVKRGDLVFWRGHVGIVQSNEWMIHASGHQMEVVVEPVRRAVERIATTHGNVNSVRRLHGLDLTS